MSKPRHRHRRRGRFPAPTLSRGRKDLLVVGVAILVTSFALRATAYTGSDTATCSGDVVLAVEVAPRVAAPVRSAADAYQTTTPAADGQCVTLRVSTRAPHETARLLGGGWSESAAGTKPDVWIPDSATWVELARLAEPARRLLPEAGTTVATSPVVIALPRTMAETLGWPAKRLTWKDIQANEGDADFWADRGHPDWGPFRVVIPHPQASPASADAMLSMVSVAVGTPLDQLTQEAFDEDIFVKKVILDMERRSGAVPASDDALLAEVRQADTEGRLLNYLSAAPTTESAVFDYNRGMVADGKAVPPEEPLVATYPADGVAVEEVPFVTLAAASRDPLRSQAADGFLRALLGETGTNAFTAEGLRTPDGTNPRLTVDSGFPPGFDFAPAASAGPQARAAALTAFQRLHRRGTSLAVFDTSGSMEREVSGSGGMTRLDVVVDAAETAIALVAPDSNLGIWQFATKLDGDKDYRELVPIGPMNEQVQGITRSIAAVGAIRSMQPEGATGLYDTALAAFRAVTANYTPGHANQVVLMTDGRNDDPGSISLDELLPILEAEFDPERPVRIITIAYGAEADAPALRRISAATGAKSYPALDSNSIFRLVVEAVSAE